MSATLSTAKATKAADNSGEEKPKGRRKKIIIIALVVLLLAATAWWFLRPKGTPEPQPGAIMPLDATQINLAEGHYLRIGIALQLTTDAGASVDGSKALDTTIDLFSGKSLAQVSQPAQRRTLKKRLTSELSEAYDGDVMGVYFTEFVTQ